MKSMGYIYVCIHSSVLVLVLFNKIDVHYLGDCQFDGFLSDEFAAVLSMLFLR